VAQGRRLVRFPGGSRHTVVRCSANVGESAVVSAVHRSEPSIWSVHETSRGHREWPKEVVLENLRPSGRQRTSDVWWFELSKARSIHVRRRSVVATSSESGANRGRRSVVSSL
jgi:hypothetical protein